MKLLVIVGCVAGLLLARPVLAADGLTFSSFHADVSVQRDASIQVTETITADFSTPHHGIYRVIPFAYTTTDGDYASIPVTISAVEQDGHSAPYTETHDRTDITVKIGDADTELSGTHTYVLRYTAQAAANFFSDHDELYWNVTGVSWDPYPQSVTATVTTPAGVHDAAGITTICYTGTYGSVAKNCEQSHTDTTASFSAHDLLTIVVGWPKGYMVMPTNFDELRRTELVPTSTHAFWRRPNIVEIAVNALVVAVIFGLMLRQWLRHGRDPGQRKTVIAQYEPPDQLRPAELYAVMHEESAKSVLVTATIVDLAVRGYIHIREVREKKIFKDHLDYEIVRQAKSDADLRPYEQKIMNSLFDGAFVTADTMKLGDLKQRRYTTNPFMVTMGSVMKSVVEAGYFNGNPQRTKINYTLLGAAMLALSFGALWIGVFAYGGVLGALIVFGFIPALPQRTSKGVEAAWVGHGFQLFIGTAEKYRLQWQERENIFETVLPYAIAFGLTEKWSRVFASLSRQPDWYTGSDATAFNVMAFSVAMNGMSSAISTATVSTAASGGSGFGGGGFSGGGGGGGGGGGW